MPLPFGEIEDNSVLKVDQYFALPKSSIFKVIVKNRVKAILLHI